jgi:ankyrin repeat protein
MPHQQSKARDAYLSQAVHRKDLDLVRTLLAEGVGPDVSEAWGDSLLHYLVHEYQVTRSTQGPVVLEILRLLLAYGANPNQVGANNWRAIDMSIDRGLTEVTEIFTRHGADPTQREFQ